MIYYCPFCKRELTEDEVRSGMPDFICKCYKED